MDTDGSIEYAADMRPPVSWMLNTLAEYAVFSAAFTAAVIAARSGRISLVKTLWVYLLIMDAVLYAASNFVIVHSEPWMRLYILELSFDIVLQVLLAIGSAVDEVRCILIIVVCCTLNNISVALCDILIYHRGWGFVLLDRLRTMAGMGVVFGIGALLFRQRALAQAYSLVLADKRRYESIWEFILADPTSRAAVLSIQEASTSLSNGHGHDPWSAPAPRQHIPNVKGGTRKVSMLTNITHFGVTHTRGGWNKKFPWNIESDLVDSLDQLFVQAWCLSPILLRKTKALALQSKGCFRYQPRGSETTIFARYSEEANNEQDVSGYFKWARVKSIRRAIEKAVRVYKQVHVA